MGLFDWLFGQFIDVIEWTDDSSDTMVYRFNRRGNAIKYGAKLTVRESQVAVFVHEGVIADILTPGIYELETKNIPILTDLEHWDHGFNSPFKAEVYFLNTKRFTDLKWGTKNPIMLRDPEFSMVRLRAFGTYEIRITDPQTFLNEIVGTDGHFTTDEIEGQLTNLILSKLATVLGEDETPVLDLAANYEKFGKYITERISPAFSDYGLELTRILIENISLPDEVERALDTRTSRELTGDLNEHVKYQSGQALGNSENGAIGDIVGIGAGLAMGQEMAKSMKEETSPPTLTKNELAYFVAIEGNSEGPFDTEAVKSLIKKGKITKKTRMWKEGMDAWQSADKVIAPLFNSTPPPLS